MPILSKVSEKMMSVELPVSTSILPILQPLNVCLDDKSIYVWVADEVDIGPGDKPRPTFISKKLDPVLREEMIALLKEYRDCFAWDYTEMPGLDRNIIEHWLPLKKGFWPFQQRARQMKAEVLEEVKKEVEKMLDAGFIRPCRYAEWISSLVPYKRRMADGMSASILEISTERRQRTNTRCLL